MINSKNRQMAGFTDQTTLFQFLFCSSHRLKSYCYRVFQIFGKKKKLFHLDQKTDFVVKKGLKVLFKAKKCNSS